MQGNANSSSLRHFSPKLWTAPYQYGFHNSRNCCRFSLHGAPYFSQCILVRRLNPSRDPCLSARRDPPGRSAKRSHLAGGRARGYARACIWPSPRFKMCAALAGLLRSSGSGGVSASATWDQLAVIRGRLGGGVEAPHRCRRRSRRPCSRMAARSSTARPTRSRRSSAAARKRSASRRSVSERCSGRARLSPGACPSPSCR